MLKSRYIPRKTGMVGRYEKLVTKIYSKIVADIGMKKKDRNKTGNIDFTHSCISDH